MGSNKFPQIRNFLTRLMPEKGLTIFVDAKQNIIHAAISDDIIVTK